MAEVVAVHALAEFDPEAKREVQFWRDKLTRASGGERDDIRIRLQRYEMGLEIVVRLAVTIEIRGDVRGSRLVPAVEGVWFTRDDPDGNREHARELVIQQARPVLDELARDGVHQRPVGLPVVLELDDRVEAAVAAPLPRR